MSGWLRRLFPLVLALVAVAAGLPATAAEPLMARTEAGLVRGLADGGVRQYQGIPFAEPPVGELRWAAPRPVRNWHGVRPAVAPGPRCAQTASGEGPATAAEDCLYLNVTAPAGQIGRKPVLVWVHGGGFIWGAGSSYHAQRLAAQGDVVVVTVNYRLGAFGFLAHPELGPAGGAFGLQDQVAALQWVRRNIGGFGGDPGNVTLLGESAGAFSICALLTVPATKPLIDRAIVQSGSCSVHLPRNGTFPGSGEYRLLVPRAQLEALGLDAASTLNCADLACLRRVDAQRWLDTGLINHFSQAGFHTDLLPEDPAAVLHSGRAHQVPMIMGFTRDELRLHTGSALVGGASYDYAHLMRDSFGPRAQEIGAAYPLTGADKYTSALAWSAVSTDAGWACPTLADAQAFNRGQPVYTYVFADRDAPNLGYQAPADFPLGAYHGSELQYLFWDAPEEPGRLGLATDLIRHWAQFARHGDPNLAGKPSWPRFDGVNAQSFSPRDTGSVNAGAQHHCRLWTAR